MNNQYFSIQKLNFDLNLASRSKAHELQNTISNIFRNDVQPRLNDFFEKRISAEAVLKKDLLILDVGTIPYHHLEKELTNRIMAELEKLFSEQFFYKNNKLYYGTDYKSDEISTSFLQVLEQFLLTGVFSWAFSDASGIDLHDLLDEIYKKDKTVLRQLLQRLGQHAFVRKRIAYQFANEDIKRIIEVVDPSYANYIYEYHSNIANLHQEKQIVKSGSEDFKKSLWNFILTYLLGEKGSEFDKKMFVKSTLSQIASHFNIKYLELLQLLQSALTLEKNNFTDTYSLPFLITELSNEIKSFPPSMEKKTTNFSTKAISLLEKMRLCEYYLLYGTLPLGSGWTSEKEIEAYFLELIKTIPNTFRKIIVPIINQGIDKGSINFLLKSDMLQGLVKLITPANKVFISQYLWAWQTVEKERKLAGLESVTVLSYILQQTSIYLNSQEGVVLDKKEFIVHSLSLIQQKFGVAPKVMLRSLGESFKNSDLKSLGLNSESVYENLLKDPEIEASISQRSIFPIKKGLISETDFAANEQVIKTRALKDVINHLLLYGSLPWWAKEYAGKSCENLFNELYNYASIDAVLLMKFAGTDGKMKRRFLWQLSPELIKKIILKFPEGKEALINYEDFLTLIAGTAAFASIQTTSFVNLLLQTLWDVFINTNYTTFDNIEFYKITVQRLSILLQVQSVQLVLVLMSSFEKLKKAAFFPSDKLEKIQLLLHQVRESDQTEIDKNNISKTISDTQYFSPVTLVGKEERLRKFKSLLEHFLSFNSFPDDLNNIESNEKDDLLKEILVTLFYDGSAALKNILAKESHSPIARMRLHDLFSEQQGGEGKQVSKFLEQYRQNDITLYLLKTTGMPENTDIAFLKQNVIDFINGDTNVLWKKTITSVVRSTTVARFIADLLTDHEVNTLINKFYKWNKRKSALLKETKEIFLSTISDNSEKNRLSLLINEYNLLQLSSPLDLIHTEYYLKKLVEYLDNSSLELQPILNQLVNTRENINAHIRVTSFPIVVEIIKVLEETIAVAERNEAIKKSIEFETKSIKGDEQEKKKKRLEAIKQELKKIEREEENVKEKKVIKQLVSDEDKIYINNAGLVLLHPFLGTYFNRLSLMEKGKFVSEEAQLRAALLLQYMVTGNLSHEEHTLVLNKLLCNIALEEPVPKEIVLKETEIAVSNELLKVVIERSGKLVNSSIEGFRASFLQRDGALKKIKEDWNLRVDQRGYDVLLQYLPWAFGMIKLSWMDKTIFVEWI